MKNIFNRFQPDESNRVCYYGAYRNTNVWRHHGSQYRVHAQVIFELSEPLGEWEVQLVFDEGKKMLVLETPQMVKRDKSKDSQYWSFGPADFNPVIMSRTTKFFMTGAMWRSAPAPHSGIMQNLGEIYYLSTSPWWSTVKYFTKKIRFFFGQNFVFLSKISILIKI